MNKLIVKIKKNKCKLFELILSLVITVYGIVYSYSHNQYFLMTLLILYTTFFVKKLKEIWNKFWS